MLDIIDQMRVTIPDEIKKAQQLLAQRDRMLAQAQEEANRTLALAREKGEQIIEQDVVVKAAKERADQILDQAEKDVESIKRDADVYALQTLADLEMELDRVLGQVRNGVRTLQDELNRPPAE